MSNLCNPMDCSLPGSSVHETLQARILEWVAMPSPGDLPNPEIKPASLSFLRWQAGSLPLVPAAKPLTSETWALICCLVSGKVVAFYIKGIHIRNVSWSSSLMVPLSGPPLKRNAQGGTRGVPWHPWLQIIRGIVMMLYADMPRVAQTL